MEKMDSNVDKREKFPSTSSELVSVPFRSKGTLARKHITVSIAPTKHNYYINAEFANHLLIPESNIIMD